MGKRTNAQIKKDKEELHNKKVKALRDLNEHIADVSSLGKEDTEKIGCFINLFAQCETVYKTLYTEMKKIQGENIDVRQLKFNIQKFEAALRFFGIEYDSEKMKTMFAFKKSYLTCRDKILHGLNKDAIDEVLANYNAMKLIMSEFLNCVANGQPDKE